MLRGVLRPVLGVAFGFLLPAVVIPQTTADPGSDKTLRELLDEVRLLRRVLQESSVGSLRAQILLTQRQSHDEKAAQLDRQLTSIRSARNDVANQIARMNARVPEAERILSNETDPEKRSEIESQMKMMSLERDQLQQNQQKSIEREQELEAQLSREKDEVEAIQKELNRIESDLAAIQKSRPVADSK